MIVGFTIIDANGHEKELSSYIKKVCLLEDSQIIDNIISAGAGVNVWSMGIEEEELYSQQFLFKPIRLIKDKHLIISATDYVIETTFNGNPLRIAPTEYLYVSTEELPQFEELIAIGEVKKISWVLENGCWDDNGYWDDNNYLIDE